MLNIKEFIMISEFHSLERYSWGTCPTDLTGSSEIILESDFSILWRLKFYFSIHYQVSTLQINTASK